MQRNMLRICAMIICLATAVRGVELADAPGNQGKKGAKASAQLGADILIKDVSGAGDRLKPLLKVVRVREYYPDGYRHPGDIAAVTQLVEDPDPVYGNDLGTYVYSPGASIPIADDLFTEAADSFALT